MAVRDSMQALIGKVRFEIGDTVQPYVLTDQEIQDQLDRRRRDVRYNSLTYVETVLPGGLIQYNDFWAPVGDWEDDVQLVDNGYNVLTPLTSEPLLGHWTFTAGSITTPDMYATGRIYDVYGSAADLCGAWLAKIKMDFTESVQFAEVGGRSGTTTAYRQQRIDNLKALQSDLRKKAWVITSRFTRPDLNPVRRRGVPHVSDWTAGFY